MPSGLDFNIHNDYDGRSRRRIGFREGPIAGVGMLDLLTFRDEFTDYHLSASEFFGRGASHIRLSFRVSRLFSLWLGGLERLLLFFLFVLILFVSSMINTCRQAAPITKFFPFDAGAQAIALYRGTTSLFMFRMCSGFINM